jgi:hypothetical protein
MTDVYVESSWIDCGDNGCICCPSERRTGMRTNGVCQCFRSGNFLNLTPEENRKIRRVVLYWRERALYAENRLEKVKRNLKKVEP